MITVAVGDITEYLSQQAKHIDPDAKLITEANFHNLTPGVYYTSLGDFSRMIDFINTLDQADTLIYWPPTTWSDQNQSHSNMKFWTEYYLMYFWNQKTIVNNNQVPLMDQTKNNMLQLVDSRKTNAKQLWVSGCSVTYGTGIDPEQRYGQLLADALDLPVSFLSLPSTSIQWSADQILRSDIRAGDTVVWGITNFARFSYFTDGKVERIGSSYYQLHPTFNKIVPIERLDDENMAYQNLTRIHAVLNFCKKIQAKLFLFGLLVDHYDLKWTADLPNYKQLYGRFGFDDGLYLDFGTDNMHPGPITHQWYAQQMLSTIKE